MSTSISFSPSHQDNSNRFFLLSGTGNNIGYLVFMGRGMTTITQTQFSTHRKFETKQDRQERNICIVIRFASTFESVINFIFAERRFARSVRFMGRRKLVRCQIKYLAAWMNGTNKNKIALSRFRLPQARAFVGDSLRKCIYSEREKKNRVRLFAGN